VRNALLGRPVSDLDIATTASPQEVMALARAAGLDCVPTGLRHGTVTVLSHRVPHEVTTLREDVETFGRHARVAFTADWAADARRRDFTINALYCDAGGVVLDPLGGYGDIVARRVRFIGEADARIAEDYLRILRFFRFNAEYGSGECDRAGLEACQRGRGGLAGLSAERIRAELIKLLIAPMAVAVVETMLAWGLLLQVFGAVSAPQRLARLAAIEEALDLAPDPVRRLAALTVHVREDAGRLATRLRLSNAEQRALTDGANEAPRLMPGLAESEARIALYRLGAETFRARTLAAWTSAAAGEAARWRDLYGLPDRWRVPRLPVDGTDLIACGIAAGPAIGQHLRRLEEHWIAGGFSASRDQLLALPAVEPGA
jgi:tRNA nucleotidyltransferase/poly(A) polymerase